LGEAWRISAPRGRRYAREAGRAAQGLLHRTCAAAARCASRAEARTRIGTRPRAAVVLEAFMPACTLPGGEEAFSAVPFAFFS
jgi:hypothetical protein